MIAAHSRTTASVSIPSTLTRDPAGTSKAPSLALGSMNSVPRTGFCSWWGEPPELAVPPMEDAGS